MSDKLGITGLQEALYDNQKRIAALRPSSAYGRAIRDVTVRLQRYAIGITHVWPDKGGGLRASHRMEVKELRGRIYIDPGAVNPRGQKPSIYGPYEEARGGSHAFYNRTVDEAGPGEVTAVLRQLGRILV
jgi:hypothetical protein